MRTLPLLAESSRPRAAPKEGNGRPYRKERPDHRQGLRHEALRLLEPAKFLREAGAEVTIAAASQPCRLRHGRPLRLSADRARQEPRRGRRRGLRRPHRPGRHRQHGPSAHETRSALHVVEFMDAKKVVACICHGPWLLVNAGVAKGKTVTSCEFNRIDMENGELRGSTRRPTSTTPTARRSSRAAAPTTSGPSAPPSPPRWPRRHASRIARGTLRSWFRRVPLCGDEFCGAAASWP